MAIKWYPVEPALEGNAQRDVKLMGLSGRFMPDFKTIANFRKDNRRNSAVSVACSLYFASGW